MGREGIGYWQSKRLGRRPFLRSSGVAAAAGAALLAGCGSKSGTGTGSSSAPSSGGQPEKGGVINHWLNTDPSSLDVHQTSTYIAVWPECPCYNQLVQYDPKDPDNKISPELADSYEVGGDGTSVTFKLHSGVKFHDGSDFTSEDVKANLDWIKNPPEKKPSPKQSVLGAIDRVETPDPLTAKLVLKTPSASLIPNLATHYLVIGAKGDLAKGDLGTQMNGTGPFKLKNYTRGVGVELERNPNYWVKDRPYLDGLKYAIVADVNTSFTDFLAGHFNRYYEVLPENVDRIAKETGGRAKAVSPLSTLRDEVFFNGTKKPYNDPRVRQAVSLVIDRQAAGQIVMGGRATPGGYMLPGGAWAISSDQLKKVPGYDKPDIAEAKKLLAAAGVTEPLSGVMLTRSDATFVAMATYLQGNLQKALGWNFKLDVKDNAAATAAAYAGQFDLIAWTIGITIDDPDATFAEIAIKQAVRNWSQIYDSEADALYAKQSQTVDVNQRKQLVQQLELKFMNDFPVVTLYFKQAVHGIWNNVRDYKVASSLYTNQRYQDAWVSKS
jgi:peptide/nickel transport system substrate-binding protein